MRGIFRVRLAARACALLLVCVADAQAQKLIHVPGDQPTIQAGVNAAQNGDTVLVSPGTYYEAIDFSGKNLTLTSSDGAKTTILDGSHISGWIVTFGGGQATRQSVLNGFTIRNACADAWPVWDPTVGCGGVEAYGSPTITNNIISNNYGYGIYGYGPRIVANTVSYTKSQYNPLYDYGCDYADGSGISVRGPSEITGNIIEYNGNVGTTKGAPASGGGVNITGLASASSNVIRYNTAACNGGGIYVYVNNIPIIQNLIYGNVAGAAGGGVFFQTTSSSNYNTGPLQIFVINNTFVNNAIHPNFSNSAYKAGSQLAFGGYVSQTGLFNNIVYSTDSYEAIYCSSTYAYLSATPLVTDHNDIVSTSGPKYGGSKWCMDSTGTAGNISVDPQFVEPGSDDFHLRSSSPAIDAGNNAAPMIPAIDIVGNVRIQRATNTEYAFIDMGAYEASPAEANAPSQTALAVQPTQLHWSEPVTLTATVVSTSSVKVGTVGFFDGTNYLGSVPVSDIGVATLMTTAVDAGTRFLTASFGGNANVAASTSSVIPISVVGAATATTVTVTPLSPTYADIITVTVTVTSAVGTPSGAVTLYDSIAPYATAALNEQGVATFSIPPNTTRGGYNLTAKYPDQSHFAASTGAASVVYQPYATVMTFVDLPDPLPAGRSFSITVRVRSTSGEIPIVPNTPYPSVRIFDGNNYVTQGLLGSNGDAILTLPALTFGTHQLSASFTPNSYPAVYAASSSAPVIRQADYVLLLTRPVRPPRASNGGFSVLMGGSQTTSASQPARAVTTTDMSRGVLAVRSFAATERVNKCADPQSDRSSSSECEHSTAEKTPQQP